MLKLKTYRDKPKGLGDLLNYAAMIDESTLLNKDGSLSTGYTYSTADLSSAALFERNAAAERMNRVLNRFGTNWTIHVDSFRVRTTAYPKPEESYFSNNVTETIDQKRREFFETQGNLYETRFTIFITYIPPSKIKAKLLDLSSDNKVTAFDTHIQYFHEKLAEFENIFEAFPDFKITPLKNFIEEDELGFEHINSPSLEYINFFITGKKHKINLPPVPMYLDSVIGAKNFIGGLEPKIGDKYIKVITIDGFPQESFPNILNTLNLMDFEYRFSSRFIYLDRNEALTLLDRERRKWNQQTTSLWQQFFNVGGTVDQHAVNMVHQIEAATADQKAGEVTFGYYISNIVIMDTNKASLQKKANLAIQNIETLGFAAMVQDFNAIESWLGTLPSHSIQNVRKQMISSLNFSHFIPLSNIWTGSTIAPCDKYPMNSPALLYTVSDGNIPFRLNLHVKDVGHTLLFGPTGGGKSTMLALLIAQFDRYRNSKSWVFDKGRSLYALTHAMDGNYYDLVAESDNTISFAPLSNLKTKADRIWAEDWLELVCGLHNVKFDAIKSRKIREALNTHIETGAKTLTEFVALVQDDDISEALSFYTVNGSIDILDGDDDTLTTSHISTFELGELMELGDKVVLPILLYIFQIIEKSLDGSPTAIWIDESWTVLGHPTFAPRIRKWLKELRKKNCFVFMATQSLSDAVNSGILDVLQESCPTKIFLPNPEAFKKGSENGVLGPYDFYQAFGLNDQQIKIVYDAIPKREYYYTSPEGNRKFNLVFNEYTLAFCGTSDVEDVTYIEKLIKDDKPNWIDNWLNHRLRGLGV